MLAPNQFTDAQQRLHRIQTLAHEIEAVPKFGPDLWTMRKIDEKCQLIRGDGQAISRLVGTGDVLHNTNVPAGARVVSTTAAGQIQRHLARVSVLAQAIEDVPNFGPDIWAMRKIDEESREIVAHCGQVWMLLNPSNTSGR